MKKVLLLVISGFLYLGNTAQAQSNQNLAGLTIEFGNGSTLVGPAVKHFFNENSAAQAELLFGGGGTFLAAFYQYHQKIQNAAGLNWYLGAGPAVGFGNGSTDFYIRPTAGLDYKVKDTPLNLSFDWRPTFYVGSDSEFTAARFGLGFRFAF